MEDERGTPIAVVPLARGGTAKINAADYHDLVALGVSPNWTLNSGGEGPSYVRASLRYVPANITRFLLNPRADEIVSYRNGDRTDLRRANLYLRQVRRRTRATATATAA